MRCSPADRPVVAERSLPSGGGTGAKGPAHQDCSSRSTGDHPGRKRGEQCRHHNRSPSTLKSSLCGSLQGSGGQQGCPGGDKVTLGEFESDLKNNLYNSLNRMSSGSHFAPRSRRSRSPKPSPGARRAHDRRPGGPDAGGPGSWRRMPNRGSTQTPTTAEAVGPQCASNLPRSVLELRLGHRSRCREVLRHRRRTRQVPSRSRTTAFGDQGPPPTAICTAATKASGIASGPPKTTPGVASGSPAR
jgi:hypothetical protein